MASTLNSCDEKRGLANWINAYVTSRGETGSARNASPTPPG